MKQAFRNLAVYLCYFQLIQSQTHLVILIRFLVTPIPSPNRFLFPKPSCAYSQWMMRYTPANDRFYILKTAELTSWQTHEAPGNEATSRLIVSTLAEAEHLAATSDQWNTSYHKKMNVSNPFRFLKSSSST